MSMTITVEGQGIVTNGDFLGLRINSADLGAIMSQELAKAGLDGKSDMVWGRFRFVLTTEKSIINVEKEEG